MAPKYLYIKTRHVLRNNALGVYAAQQWYILRPGQSEILLNNLLEAGCTNKLSIPVKLVDWEEQKTDVNPDSLSHSFETLWRNFLRCILPGSLLHGLGNSIHSRKYTFIFFVSAAHHVIRTSWHNINNSVNIW